METRLPFDLHLELLEVGGEAAKAVVVGQDGAGGVAADLIVPDADEREHGGQVLVPCGGRAEVAVHRLPAAQEGAEGVGADGDHQREADGAPHGVAAAHPVLEAEDAGGVDAEGGGLGERGGEGGELARRGR